MFRGIKELVTAESTICGDLTCVIIVHTNKSLADSLIQKCWQFYLLHFKFGSLLCMTTVKICFPPQFCFTGKQPKWLRNFKKKDLFLFFLTYWIFLLYCGIYYIIYWYFLLYYKFYVMQRKPSNLFTWIPWFILNWFKSRTCIIIFFYLICLSLSILFPTPSFLFQFKFASLSCQMNSLILKRIYIYCTFKIWVIAESCLSI